MGELILWHGSQFRIGMQLNCWIGNCGNWIELRSEGTLTPAPSIQPAVSPGYAPDPVCRSEARLSIQAKRNRATKRKTHECVGPATSSQPDLHNFQVLQILIDLDSTAIYTCKC